MRKGDPLEVTANHDATADESPAQVAPIESSSGAPNADPSRIGRYRIVQRLGQGGFGTVYLAHDDDLDRPVGIKVPKPERVTRAEDAEAFLVEARILARLDHPHIVPVFDVGRTEDRLCFVVSKLIEGSDLAVRMGQGRLSFHDSAELVATVAEALHHAHTRGLVHRDIKPANILIEAPGKVFVADFGLALTDKDFGKGGGIVGTHSYMSPEQARGEGHRVDGRSDIFSLGVVFYELLTGRRPFAAKAEDKDEARHELLDLIATAEARPPRQIDDTIPKELERICLKALAKRASERYTTASDMADDLGHWLRPLSSTRVPPDLARGVGEAAETGLPATRDPDRVFFVSYASPDKEKADRLCQLLEEQGIGCWIAPRDVSPGANYGEAIIRAIEGTKATLLLLSAHSNASVHVANEVERATSKRKRVIPVRLEDVEPSPSLELHLATAQWVDAWRTSAAQTVAQLSSVVQSEVGKPTTSVRPAGSQPVPSSSDQQLLKIVPKGLRSFDEHDADFFLELLPGPRDRDGLPESIRFWKTRIENMDPDKTFRVGLIYGPSGCGKSSLVKAGLLPRLAKHILPVYLEASAEETESRLLRALRKACSDLPRHLGLVDSLMAIRQGGVLRSGQKALLVLDQFEQWLHARRGQENTELVAALRQCDGERVQAVVMVRDDFWLAASRFMRDLEIRLVEGENSFLVDLFDPRHARKVLVAFGRAYGALPENSGEISGDQDSFLDQSISGLAQDGKIVSVRLALFAEMVKGKTWAPATLKTVGGTEGIGSTFLEETFSARAAPPEHRFHQKAAQAVLKALLPESGTDIKGEMRSRQELLEASGYANRPGDFDDLIHVLDPELRLITPTDPEGASMEGQATIPGGRYYQLAHDYLVPSLRDWLTRKQRETRRGRAGLRLAERAALWHAKPENRHLPSWWEYLTAVWLVPAKNRSADQQTMLRKAGRVHAVRWGSALAVLLLIGFVIGNVIATERQSSLRRQVASAVDRLQNDRGLAVRYTLSDLEQLPPRMVVAEIKARYAEPEPRRKLGLVYAMAQYGEVDVPFLVSRVQGAAPEEVDNLVAAFGRVREAAMERIHDLAKKSEAEKNWRLKARLAVVALYLEDDGIAADMCRIADRPDPVQRTIFIDELPAWHGDVARLATYCQGRSDAALRSCLGLAVGSIPLGQFTDAEREAWQPVLTQWYETASDGGTHSAAGWALRQLGIELPALAASTEPSEGRQWLVNSLGMTLLKINPGVFVRKDQTPGAKEQTVQLTRAFFLSDREISVGQFQQFISDASYPNAEKPEYWQGADARVSPTPDHPVQQVNWYDAMLFCNWLSRKEGRTACYERTGKKEKTGNVEFDVWRLVADGTGYRLPTEAEWEYSCRAGTKTEYASGSDEEILRKYAVFQASRAASGGSKLPNGGGLFDMHGNVWEWCWDGYRQYDAKSPAVDPTGAAGVPNCVIRGGSWDDAAGVMRASDRGGFSPVYRNYFLGFRLARGQSGG